MTEEVQNDVATELESDIVPGETGLEIGVEI
jgi:hypothetical protein